MPRRGENIYKRKDGRWEGRYKKGRNASGKLKYGYIYGKRYTDVKKKLYYYTSMYQEIIEQQGEWAITYEEWIYKWLESRKQSLKPSTYSTYFYKLKKYVFPLLGNVSLNQLSQKKIQSTINEWGNQGLSNSTIHVLYQILKKSINDAYQQKKIYQNPCQNIYLPQLNRRQPHALTKSDQRKIEKNAKSLPLYKGLPILLSLNSGLRIGEISALKWEDIDFEKRTIHIRRTLQRIQKFKFNCNKKTTLIEMVPKTDTSIRTIPMSYSIYKYLKKWKSKSTSMYVCAKGNKPAEPRVITNYFYQIRDICQLNQVHFHHLRHTFATRCIESSTDVASVSRLMGHSSSKTTLDIYTDSFIEGQQRVILQMEKAK